MEEKSKDGTIKEVNQQWSEMIIDFEIYDEELIEQMTEQLEIA